MSSPSTVRHGSLTSYRQGCRCAECSTTNRRYDKKLRFDHARTGSRRVPADKAHQHLLSLLDDGASVKSIADQLGLMHTSSVYQMLKRPKMRRDTFNRVMSVRLEVGDTEWRTMDAVGCERRLKALMYMGWKLVDIGRRTGIDGTVLSDIIRGVTPKVRQRTFIRLRDFYDQNSMIDGGSNRSKLRAQREGWLSPLAWDDIDRDRKPSGVRR